MATTYGVTLSGFVIKTYEILNDAMIAAVTSAIGVTPVDALLALINIITERLAELWQLAQAIYNSGDVDAATGAAQDNINSITATIREIALPSTVTLTWTGNPGIPVPATTTQARTLVSLQVFTVGTTGTLVALPAYVGGSAYVTGDRVTNASRVYLCTLGGNTINNAPTGTDVAWNDGPVVWRYIGEGTAAIDLPATCTITGPVIASAYSIQGVSSIVTPIAGVLGVANLTDAIVGRDKETDADYRVRREQELAKPGSGTTAKIKAAITDITGTSNITVFQNTGDLTNVDGMLPHSVELLVIGGNDTTIATTLFESVDAGIQTVGKTTVNVTDENGFIQIVKFSRPVQKLIYNSLSITYDPATFPADGSTQIKNAIVAYGQLLACGIDARPYQVGRVAGKVAGVLDITANTIGLSPSPAGTANIAVALRELAVYDTSRIVLTLTPGTP